MKHLLGIEGLEGDDIDDSPYCACGCEPDEE